MKLTGKRLALASLAAVLGVSSVGSTALAGPRMEIAVEDEQAPSMPEGSPLRDAVFARGRELGANHLRLDIWWVRNAPFDAAYFAKYDSFVNEAIKKGYVVQLTLGGIAADWGGPNRSGVNPDPKEWAKFVRATVRHFKDRVKRFSLWNEPNHPGFLAVTSKQKNAKALRYRQLYRLGARIVRKEAPKAQILFGELSGTNLVSFVGQVTKGARLKADGLAMHPYQYQVEPGMKYPSNKAGISNLPSVQKMLKALAKSGDLGRYHGKGAVPLYCTEFGYHKMEGRFSQPKVQIPEIVRAKWLPEAFALAKRVGAREMLYYEMVPSPSWHPWDTSILDGNGNPLASFNALKSWVAKHNR